MFVDEFNIIGDCAQRFSEKYGITYDESMQLLKDCGIYDKMVRCYRVLGEETDETLDEKVQEYIDAYLNSKMIRLTEDIPEVGYHDDEGRLILPMDEYEL